jgi:hypothetical protein
MFYAPGFAERGRWPAYLILVHRDGLELHSWLSPHLDPPVNEVGYFVRFDSVAECRVWADAWADASELPPAESRAIPRLHAVRDEARARSRRACAPLCRRRVHRTRPQHRTQGIGGPWPTRADPTKRTASNDRGGNYR